MSTVDPNMAAQGDPALLLPYLENRSLPTMGWDGIRDLEMGLAWRIQTDPMCYHKSPCKRSKGTFERHREKGVT